MNDKIIVKGTTVPLNGRVVISGAKNAVLPLMAATLLAEGRTTLTNVPNLSDISAMIGLLNELGAKAHFHKSTVTVDVPHTLCTEATSGFVQRFRASYYILGPLLARHNQATVGLPGGCAWGERPIDLHLQGMKQLGAETHVVDGKIVASGRLEGSVFRFNKISVGATANVLMAAVLSEGEAVLENCAIEPEITNLVDMLISMGARIQGRESRTLRITGVKKLYPTNFRVIPDRIEAGTFLAAAAITGGSIEITHCEPRHMEAVIGKMREAGCQIRIDSSAIFASGPKRLKSVDMTTEEYPGFPTDMQAIWMAMMTMAEGTSVITETIYHDRFAHAHELMKLNADIQVLARKAIVTGKPRLAGGEAKSTDLRGSACLMLVALRSWNYTLVSDVYHADRGYEAIEFKLANVGARIVRVDGKMASEPLLADTKPSSPPRRSSVAAVAA